MSKATTRPAPKATKGKGGAAETVNLRFEFYRDGFRAMASAMPVVVTALLISVGLNAWQATRGPQERYFTVDAAGRIIKIVALTEPYVTDAYVTNWVTEKVSLAYSMDPQNYRRQIPALKPYFTPDGHEQYQQSLVSSGTLELMTKNLLVMSGVPVGTPVVVSKDVANGIFFWKVQIPMLVEYRSSTKSAQKRRVVEVTVVRRQTIESPEGIGISQFVASDS